MLSIAMNSHMCYMLCVCDSSETSGFILLEIHRNTRQVNNFMADASHQIKYNNSTYVFIYLFILKMADILGTFGNLTSEVTNKT